MKSKLKFVVIILLLFNILFALTMGYIQVRVLGSIKAAAALNYKNLIVVAKAGGDYTTITQAINYAKTTDTVANPVTILICPGTYREHLSIYGYQISLIGINKKTCIVRDDSGNYYKPPLEMAGPVRVDNLTFIATHDADELTTLRSYAVHHDFPGEGVSEIHNCIMISKQACAIGIGLQNNQTLIIENCEMYGLTDPGLLMHPYPLTAIGQKLIVKRSRISSGSDKALSLIDSNNNGQSGGSGDNRNTTLSFYNNIAWSETTGKTNLIYGTAPMGDGQFGHMKLSADSFGNNIPELNSLKADTATQFTFKANVTDVNSQIASVANRGPDEPFATLALLHKAYPTGTSKNKVVAFTGNVYAWKGSPWNDTGIKYLSTGKTSMYSIMDIMTLISNK